MQDERRGKNKHKNPSKSSFYLQPLLEHYSKGMQVQKPINQKTRKTLQNDLFKKNGEFYGSKFKPTNLLLLETRSENLKKHGGA